MSVRILLVDDHPIVRDGLRVVLEADLTFRVVGETGDGLEVVPLVESLQPDVLVLDLMLPGMGGLEITHQVRAKMPQVRIVILSMHESAAYVAEALRAGALAYILKKSASDELVRSIHVVLAGERYLSSLISEGAIEAYWEVAQEEVDLYETLSARERQVLHLVTEGLTNLEIAQRLGISVRTVETYRANLMRKLDVGSTAELVRYALGRGIQPP
ncbi:MAG: response regulator transcription factor [Anaerolineales bacterium]|nr:response regulator transcription factor [Anaerolineales bacterium]